MSKAAERRLEHFVKEVAKPEPKTIKNAFADLAEDSSDEDEVPPAPSTPKKEVMGMTPGAPKKKRPVNWADWSDSEDEE